MNVCSPKDGFVIKVLVQDGSPVSAGAVLLQMDTDWEDRTVERIRVREALRVIDAAQYNGEQIALVLSVAQAALDSAEAHYKDAEIEHEKAAALVRFGNTPDPNTESYRLATEARFAQATFDRDRARADHKQLQYSIERHNNVNALAKSLNDYYTTEIKKRIERLTIAAPTNG